MAKDKLFLIRDAGGAVWFVQAKDSEAAYKAFGVQKLGMADTKDFDTGNVDVDLTELVPTYYLHGTVINPFEEFDNPSEGK